ncbi:RNA methyltransferase [Pedobacter sp. BS3]|uniref:TrmH family RNA methyltransferase n=1 Tax=Pedobacter sp. BS3 TaxID=2567937 RepID=UPI0011EC64AF|nr:TrmH family RNA methyltransferase [Pedobacter sp. BS3]TZF81357.1 RNA methyltransferase [Pedobacter sp. BS3]
MLSKSQISFIKSLHQKKFRKEHGLFIVEGLKSVTEFIRSAYNVHSVFFTEPAGSKMLNLSKKINSQLISDNELHKISALTNPQQVLALVHIPPVQAVQSQHFSNKLSLMLDGVQDPGNLGTIIRTANWFGFDELLCSTDTVDCYNPKVVQATMGSLSRINVHYLDLTTLLKTTHLPVYGALLEGENIYNTNFSDAGFVILGNEGNGISAETARYITHPFTIPGIGKAESLNVSVSAGIICSELKRKYLK